MLGQRALRLEKRGKRGETCECDTVLQVKPGVGYVVLQETGGLCLLLPAGNGFAAATGLCCPVGSPELKLPMLLLSTHLSFC